MNTLDCKDIKAMLSGLVDGEVDSPTRHTAERHLADCADCRTRLNEAERLNIMLASDAAAMLGSTELPAGFTDAVLRQTVYAEAYQFAGRRWTSWLGWVAAAACLMLAVSIWFLDRQVITPGVAKKSNNELTLVDPKAREFVKNDAPVIVNNEDLAPLDPEVVRHLDEQLHAYQAIRRVSNDAPAPTPTLIQRAAVSRDDADTLDSVSTLLDMLQRADLGSFADVERIRQIALYDDILDRLAQTRNHLIADDRPAVQTAESLLLRIVHGPISQDDLRFMREIANSMGLASQIGNLSNRPDTATSL